MVDDVTTRRVIGAFYEVYNTLGYGFLEAVYARALECELRARGLAVTREVLIDVHYKGALVGVFRADMLVEQRLVVELKATPALVRADTAQLMNYLRGGGLGEGLLLHFGPEPGFRMVRIPSEGKAPRVIEKGQNDERNASALHNNDN
jgi:GxxExxY protein